MPRTDATTRNRTRGRILAVAGATAALAGAGTAAAATAGASTVPAPGLSPAHSRPALTAAGQASPLAPAHAAKPAHAMAEHAAKPARHARATAKTGHAVQARPAAKAHARPARARHQAGQVKPHQMYDSVTPAAIPAGKAVATYATGPYAASPGDVTGRHVTWIDTNGTDPKGATVLDVEPGDATPAGAATWAAQRLTAHPHGTAVIYTMRSEWAATQAAISSLPHWQQHHIRYWIADPTGVPHIVPGSDATQWYWGTHYDISTVNPSF
jgi:hypothetical protein